MNNKQTGRDVTVTFRLSAGEKAVIEQLRAALYEFDRARDIPSASDVERWLIAHARDALRKSPRAFLKELTQFRDV